jgi:hypothetical protein
MDRIPMQVRPDGPFPRDHGHAPGFNGSAMLRTAHQRRRLGITAVLGPFPQRRLNKRAHGQ